MNEVLNEEGEPARAVPAIPIIPHLVEMNVKGFRGFTENALIKFGIPNGKRGSWLNFICRP